MPLMPSTEMCFVGYIKKSMPKILFVSNEIFMISKDNS